MRCLLAVCLGLFLNHVEGVAQQDAAPGATLGRVERLDPALDELVAPEAKIELLASGFEWSEGPVWVRDGGFVLFTDVPNNVVYRWEAGEGLSVYLQPAGFTGSTTQSPEPGANGLAIDAEGRLLLCQQGDRQIARMDAPISAPRPEFTALVDNFAGKRLSSPNDLVLHSSGAIYFSDPPFGLPGQFDSAERETEFNGVYRASPPEDAKLVTSEFVAPNGVAFSPDESILYVSQTSSEYAVVKAYAVGPDGAIGDSWVFFDATPLLETRVGLPDGLKADREGNIFATGPGGVLVLNSDGKHLGTIMTGERVSNCAFGDDGRTLYITSDMHLCRIRLKTLGSGFEGQ